MDMAAQMLQFAQLGIVERRAEAELADRAIGAGLPARIACNQGNLHAPLQMGQTAAMSCVDLPTTRILTNRPDAR